jgi:phage FluMu protein gp41
MAEQIKLEAGVEIDGTLVKTLAMREPTVGDQIAAQEVKGSPAAQEVALVANLCEIAPADVQRLTLRDYARVQEALRGFTE